jgi:hypothetical protein
MPTVIFRANWAASFYFQPTRHQEESIELIPAAEVTDDLPRKVCVSGIWQKKK